MPIPSSRAGTPDIAAHTLIVMPETGGSRSDDNVGASLAGDPSREDRENEHRATWDDDGVRIGATAGPGVVPVLVGLPQALSVAMQCIVLKAQIKFTVLYAVQAANPWSRASEEHPVEAEVSRRELAEQIKQVYRFSTLQVEDAVDREFREFEDAELWRPAG